MIDTVPGGSCANAWIKNARLYCNAYIPSDAYWSIPSCLAAGTFVEMTMTIKNLSRNKGKLVFIGLDFELTVMDEDEIRDLPGDPVRIELGD